MNKFIEFLKFIKENRSDVIAIISLLVSIWLAFSANSIAKKANEMTNHSSILKIRDFGIKIKSNNPQTGIIRVDKKELSGATITLSGKFNLEYGEISNLYVVTRDVVENNLKVERLEINKEDKKNNFKIKDYEMGLQELGKNNNINNHIYIIAVDESHKIHRVMFEISMRPSYYSYPTEEGHGNLEYFQDNATNPNISWRSFDDFDLLQLSKIKSEDNWNIQNSNKRKNVNYQPISEETVKEDIDAISELFATYGFSN